MDRSKVILIGSHLGGSLAVWTQQKYPLLIDAVWAHGAPLRANDSLPRLLDYSRNFVRNAGGPKCLRAIDDMFSILRKELDSQSSLEELADVFNMCPEGELKSHFDQTTFLYRLSSAITRPLFSDNVRELSDGLCYDQLDPGYLDSVEAFAPHFLGRQQREPGVPCLNYSFKWFLNSSVNRNGGLIDSWAYQSCSEYGWFPDDGGVAKGGGKGQSSSWFPSPAFFKAFCYNAFSMLDEQRILAYEETNRLLKGIESGEEELVLTYGELDPWTETGVKELKAEGDKRHLIVIKGE